MTLTSYISKAPRISSCRKVGAIDGGMETTPANGLIPTAMDRKVIARIPINTAPGTRRASSTTITMKPSMGKQRARPGEIAEADQRRRIIHHDAGAL